MKTLPYKGDVVFDGKEFRTVGGKKLTFNKDTGEVKEE